MPPKKRSRKPVATSVVAKRTSNRNIVYVQYFSQQYRLHEQVIARVVQNGSWFAATIVELDEYMAKVHQTGTHMNYLIGIETLNFARLGKPEYFTESLREGEKIYYRPSTAHFQVGQIWKLKGDSNTSIITAKDFESITLKNSMGSFITLRGNDLLDEMETLVSAPDAIIEEKKNIYCLGSDSEEEEKKPDLLELLKNKLNGNFRERIAAQDKDGDWYESKVLALKDYKVKVHYMGFGADTDEWISLTRLSPFLDHFEQIPDGEKGDLQPLPAYTSFYSHLELPMWKRFVKIREEKCRACGETDVRILFGSDKVCDECKDKLCFKQGCYKIRLRLFDYCQDHLCDRCQQQPRFSSYTVCMDCQEEEEEETKYSVADQEEGFKKMDQDYEEEKKKLNADEKKCGSEGCTEARLKNSKGCGYHGCLYKLGLCHEVVATASYGYCPQHYKTRKEQKSMEEGDDASDSDKCIKCNTRIDGDVYYLKEDLEKKSVKPYCEECYNNKRHPEAKEETKKCQYDSCEEASISGYKGCLHHICSYEDCGEVETGGSIYCKNHTTAEMEGEQESRLIAPLPVPKANAPEEKKEALQEGELCSECKENPYCKAYTSEAGYWDLCKACLVAAVQEGVYLNKIEYLLPVQKSMEEVFLNFSDRRLIAPDDFVYQLSVKRVLETMSKHSVVMEVGTNHREVLANEKVKLASVIPNRAETLSRSKVIYKMREAGFKPFFVKWSKRGEDSPRFNLVQLKAPSNTAELFGYTLVQSYWDLETDQADQEVKSIANEKVQWVIIDEVKYVCQ